MTAAALESEADVPHLSPAVEVALFREHLSTIDVDALTDDERLELVTELERLKGGTSATQARAVT